MSLRKEKSLIGQLDSYYEQGMEYSVGVLALDRAIYKERLYFPCEGDLLTVFNNKARTGVILEEKLEFSWPQGNLMVPKCFTKDEWTKLLWSKNYVTIIPSQYVDDVLEQENKEKKLNDEVVKEEKKDVQKNNLSSLKRYLKLKK